MDKTSENISKTNLSYGSSLVSGFNLYNKYLGRIFKLSWTKALLFSLAYCLLAVIVSQFLPETIRHTIIMLESGMPLSPDIYITPMALLISTIILGGIFELMCYSCGTAILSQHMLDETCNVNIRWWSIDVKCFWRILKAAACNLLIGILCILPFAAIMYFLPKNILTTPSEHTVSLCIIVLSMLVLALITIPLWFCTTKYIYSHEHGYWKTLAINYSSGLRHMGHILIVVLITLIIISIIGTIISLPANILINANSQAFNGMLNGDPLGMPEGINVLAIITFIAIGFFQPLIRMPLLFTTYFMYKTIDSIEEERKQEIKENQHID